MEWKVPKACLPISPCGVTAQVMFSCQSTGLLKAESKFWGPLTSYQGPLRDDPRSKR